ncbi:conserved hypothetical protein [Theileria orientalis strain Shintoku]|uniref:Uncharacterized protein n=1 Tax=Theileria orientalis strain Shintoku TaxID=869250 RepID=J4C3R5_THEOR|nr:conserved hypothetical protein [Theileria orientalis strain Shintoku]BAM40901.1 conserved hypothetical protein [Theileria orientalis strain Shintoku]|eukprot:XP_009691202.1 conserved hypothetical protein [Theileria orientalis strain Shintoku]
MSPGTTTTRSNHQYKPDSAIKKAALFFAGLSLLLTMRVGLNGAAFCLKRFQLDEKLFGIYVSRIYSAMELFCLMSVTIGTIYVQTYEKYFENISIGVSIAFSFINIILLLVFISGGKDGRLTGFYWTLIASAVIYGQKQVFIFQLAGESLVYYLAAIPLSGIMVSTFQVLTLKLFGDRRRFNTDLLVVGFQICLSVVITSIAAILWAQVFVKGENSLVNQKNNREAKKKQKDIENGSVASNGQTYGNAHNQVGILKDLPVISPMIMSIIGLGTTFAFYPSIAPGKLVDFKYINNIDVIIMILSSFPAALVAIVSEVTDYGANKEWTSTNGFWHAFLFFPFVQVVCEILFIKVLHFPKSETAKMFKNPRVAAFFSVLFFLCHATSVGVGMAGVFPNSGPKTTTLNLFLTMCTMNILNFLSGGYMLEYNKYDRAHWPTRAMGNCAAFRFWLKKGAINGLVNVKAVFTRNLRRDILAAVAT